MSSYCDVITEVCAIYISSICKYIAQMCVHKKVKFVVVSTHGSVLGMHLRSVHMHTSVTVAIGKVLMAGCWPGSPY